MNEIYIFWICIIVSVFGLLILVGLVLFGILIMRKSLSRHVDDFPYWEKYIFLWIDRDPNGLGDIPQHIINGYTEYLQRRNEFWTSFGQIIIAVLIALVLTILLLTKAISAEAGLPILSGISGFAIAKGVSSSKSVNIPQDRNRRQE
jgi:ABC-type multidrug transport system fused ATPase/permease subunit